MTVAGEAACSICSTPVARAPAWPAAMVRADGEEEARPRDQGRCPRDRRAPAWPPPGGGVSSGPGRGGGERLLGRAADDLRVRTRRAHPVAATVPRAHRVLR